MAQRSLVTVLAALGGVLVILGGILGFLLSFAPGGLGARFGGELDALVLGALAVVFGFVILVYSGYTHLRGSERSLTGGVVLVILGVVTWVVVGEWVLVAVGSFLTVMAGFVLVAQLLLGEPRVRSSSTP